MRKIIFVLLLTLVCPAPAFCQKIPYFLPKKVFEVTVPYSIITVQEVYKKDKKPKTAPKIKIVIKDEIKVTAKLYNDIPKPIDLSLLGRGGKSYKFEVGYDSDGHGSLASLNASQEPVTGEIIKGTVGIVSSLLKAVSSGIFGFAGSTGDNETEEVKTEESFVEKRIIEITDPNNPTSLSFKVGLKNPLPPGTVVEGNPETKVTFTPLSKPVDMSSITNNTEIKHKYIKLPMYIPRQYDLTVTILNNSKYINEQIIIKDIVYVPQTGILYDLAIPILKGKRTVEIAINPTTGLLTKYNITKTSTTKDIFSDSKTSMDELTNAIKELKEKNKVEEEENATKEINDQIAQLKLQNEMLDLLLKKKELEDSLNEQNKSANIKKKTK